MVGLAVALALVATVGAVAEMPPAAFFTPTSAALLAGGGIALAFAALQFRGALQANMRAPSGSAFGWLATRLMGKVNFPTIEDAVRRLGVADGERIVEVTRLLVLLVLVLVLPVLLLPVLTLSQLGAGHGVGVRALAAAGRKGLDVWAVEISARFRATLLETTALPPSRVVDADAKAMPFLASGSVDKLLAVNVVYFLDPLSVYLAELRRVLRPKTGVLLFACKFNLVSSNSAPFVNVELAPVVQAMKQAGFEVSVEEVDLSALGGAKYSYTAVTGRKL